VESSYEFGNGPLGIIKCWKLSSGYTTGGLSSSAQLHRVGRLVNRLIGQSVIQSVSQPSLALCLILNGLTYKYITENKNLIKLEISELLSENFDALDALQFGEATMWVLHSR
jgi:hypothetical protein